jgi:hypothetical protein
MSARPEITGKGGRRYLTNRLIAMRYNVCGRTVDRWQRDPRLNFPKPDEINGRKYTLEDKLDAFDRQRTVAPMEGA